MVKKPNIDRTLLSLILGYGMLLIMSKAKMSMSVTASPGRPNRTLADRAMPAAGMGKPSKS